MDGSELIVTYIKNESVSRIHSKTLKHLKDALIDIMAATIAGSAAPITQITTEYVQEQFATGNCSIMTTKHTTTPMGAALVNATAANALDVDDGHRMTKGHPGAVVFPAVIAAAEQLDTNGETFLNGLLIGYEVAIRAGILVHRLRPEYHCTGSWGAVGAAAGTSKIYGLHSNEIYQAMGIAEYHSTYSPMMRCIDAPSMVKDGIAWGCMTGLSSALLAQKGFTGIPSLFSLNGADEIINDIGKTYRVEQLYYKPHCCCRWAQPAIEGIIELQQKHHISNEAIEKVIIHTFTESARLQQSPPRTTEEAQYHLFFPAACYLAEGEVGPVQVLNSLSNPRVLALMTKMEAHIDPEFDDVFPEKAMSRIEIVTVSGDRYYSLDHQARGDYDLPLSDHERAAKYYRLVEPVIGKEKSRHLLEVMQDIEHVTSMKAFMKLLKA
jgi:2-methylcitrate dehydratase PrpD